ncbi:MAG: hypothetical protein M3R38_27060 [Actinomycetota bacterium]|nr:hypothetical protein [Actinomycetota bacterium]
MSLPSGYRIEKRGHLLYLLFGAIEVFAVRDTRQAFDDLRPIAEWHARERLATVAAWKAPFQSDEQKKAEELREEAERMMRRAMVEASGVTWR